MIYFIQAAGTRLIKIGYTGGKSAEGRLTSLQTSCHHHLKLIGTIEGGRRQEKNIHEKFKKSRSRGEWFKVSEDIFLFLEEKGFLIQGTKFKTAAFDLTIGLDCLTHRDAYHRYVKGETMTPQEKRMLLTLKERELINDWKSAYRQKRIDDYGGAAAYMKMRKEGIIE